MYQVKCVYDRISKEDKSVVQSVMLRSVPLNEVMSDSQRLIENLANRNDTTVLTGFYVTYIVDVYDLTVPEEIRNQKLAFYGRDSLTVRETINDYFEQLGYGRLVKYDCRRGVLNDAEDAFTYFQKEFDVRSVTITDLVDLRDFTSVSNHNKVVSLETV